MAALSRTSSTPTGQAGVSLAPRSSALITREELDHVNHGPAQGLLGGTDPVSTFGLVFYEVGNMAIRAWQDAVAGARLTERITAIAGDG
jgi:hypothetical protein